MDQEEIDRRAVAILEGQRRDILLSLLRCINVTTLMEKVAPEAKLDVYGLVIVSGDSLKAAQYRELTGRRLPSDAFETVPLLCRDLEDYRIQLRQWVGRDTPIYADDGDFQLIIFVGSGFSILGISFGENQELADELTRQTLEEFRAEAKQFLVANPKERISRAGKYLAHLEQLRNPRVQDS